jgi:hypothetical protein
MAEIKTLAEWMIERGMGVDELLTATELDERVVTAVLQARYTPSPDQRRCLAAALGVEPTQIHWGHKAQVDPMYGHGPQFGRSP